MLKNFISLPVFSLLMLLAFACGNHEKKNIEKIAIKLTSEGPLYSGSNTATGTWKPDSIYEGKVKSVRFTSVRIASGDSNLNGIILNPVLQLAASQADMKKVAFFKGSPSGKVIQMQLADDQKDLADFFKGQEITFVVDYDLVPEELDQNLSFLLEFEMELLTD